MFTPVRIKLLLIAMASFCFQSCSTDPVSGWSNRYGPDPSLPSDQVGKSSDNQVAIMENLAKVAHDSSGRYDPYIITLAGFNFVDEQCDAYLHELFIIDQDRDKLKAGLNSAGLVTNAILAATPASKTSMAIVAQAFGLSSQFTDTVANSYLYGAHASTILGVVGKLQAAYRDQTAKDKAQINSEPASYSRIRGYLQLCLPPTIESKINEVLASSSGVAGSAATGVQSAGPGTSQTTKLVTP